MRQYFHACLEPTESNLAIETGIVQSIIVYIQNVRKHTTVYYMKKVYF